MRDRFLHAGLRRRFALPAAFAVALAVLAGPALAHGELVASSPQPGAIVRSVSHVDLVFSTEMFDTSIVVESPDGLPLDGSVVQKADPYLSFETVPLTEPGQYIVTYVGTDSDGDIVDGAYAFSIAEDGESPVPVSAQVDLSAVEDDGTPIVLYAVLFGGVLVIAVLAGLLAEKVRRLRS